MGFQSLHNSFVEVSDESCHKQEYSILCHERFWQSIPAKVIVHVIEDAFLATTKIVEFHDVSCTRLVIVSQYTSVGIFAFPNVKVSIYSPLSLYDKTIRFSFPFLNKDGIQLGYMGDVPMNDPIYQNTRRFVWSESNPYFFKGKAGEGIGGPHIGYNMVWPMSIMMKAFTSQDDQEIEEYVRMLINTDAGTGFMHESFHKDDPANFTRAWFAWQNTLFGELILKLVNEGKLDLLNSI